MSNYGETIFMKINITKQIEDDNMLGFLEIIESLHAEANFYL